ncbi:hypothetical protein G9C98_002552 [Cotesia typhae]|uniref:Transcription initiation factor TFIID subunit 12 domain-containing protein n=1 Tax=Cotesia typhae TaxID=2053667 RepID=A0A8J5QXA2_9HYME|nr:hypothetical protein G9C98_002552 [Cotesia typhae]
MADNHFDHSQPQNQDQGTKSSQSAEIPQFLSKSKLQDLVREVDPTEQLEEEVEEMLLQLADDFVETTNEVGTCGSPDLVPMRCDLSNVLR